METPIHLATGRWPAHSTKKSLPVGRRVAVEAVVAKIFSMYEKKKKKEPRLHSSFFCTKCKCFISPEAAEHHPCRARRIRSGPDLAIMWPNVGEILYDVTVVHTWTPGGGRGGCGKDFLHVRKKKR